MKPKFRYEVSVVLFEQINVMHTLVLILDMKQNIMALHLNSAWRSCWWNTFVF